MPEVITADNVSRRYKNHVALRPLSATFSPGSRTVIIGPSGCGKSTLLRILMGLVRTDSGQVLYGDTVMTAQNVRQLRHSVGYVIQDGGLFPHLTAERNITLLARYLHRSPDFIAERQAQLAALVQLPPDMLRRYPAELSGGQRQRVGLMRALMLDPDVLLLDEPLGALDPITRYELQEQLREIFVRLGKTVVMVTHDMGEAAYFGQEILLMKDGAIVQKGALDDFLKRPAGLFVSEFIRAQRSPLPVLP